MPTQTRIANKTQWALLDTIARCKDATRRWRVAMEMAEKNMDPRMMGLLGKLRDDIAVIEDIAKLALKGEYEDRGRESSK